MMAPLRSRRGTAARPLLPLPVLLSVLVATLLSCSSLLLLPCHSQMLVLPASTSVGPHAALWPQPYQVQYDATLANGGPTLYADPDNFQIVWDNLVQVREPLLTQRQEIRGKLFPLPADPQQDPSLPRLSGLQIHVDCPECEFQIDFSQAQSNETYNITIGAVGADGTAIASLYAPTAWGAIWGIQTFAQLLNFDNNNYLLYNSSISIYDVPRFQYRGVLLDTSHHFISVANMKRILDGMSANKMNVLHWMQRSAVATSIASDIFPELTADPDNDANPNDGGAYAAAATFSQTDVFALVQYAKNHGIHVIIEQGGLEASASFGKSHPELMACPTLLAQGYPTYEAISMNPLDNSTLDFLSQYWGEIDQTSTDFIHMGGDLLDYAACWALNENITTYAAMNGLSYDQIQSAFLSAVWSQVVQPGQVFSNSQSMMYRASAVNLDQFPLTNSSAMFADWQANGVLFQAMDSFSMASLTTQQWDVVYSGADWDLADLSWIPAATSANVFDTWKMVYQVDPLFEVAAANADYVLGGQVSMYTQQVDQENIQEMLWPRASAAAERLWSDPSVTNNPDDPETLFRLQSQVCRMQRSGMRSGVLRPGYCAGKTRPVRSSTSGIRLTWLQFGFMIAFSAIGGLYALSVVLSTIAHLRAGTKAAVTASLNAPLMER